jgi:nicotinamidase-related amidase
MPDAILVVDMLRGFVEEGHPLYCGPAARAIVPKIAALLDRGVARGDAIVFVADNHDPDDAEFRVFPRHCVRGTPEAGVIPELAAFPGRLVPKTRYSAFFGTDLDQVLRALAPDKLIVVGVCTDICVLHTVADARNRDYEVEVPADCVASFDQAAHEFALRHMAKILSARVTEAR